MWELLKLSVSGLLRKSLRALLTMFGIVWGIASVIILVAIFEGFRAQNEQHWAGVGSSTVQLRYSDSFTYDGVKYPLQADPADAVFLEDYCPNVESVGVEEGEWMEMQPVSSAGDAAGGSGGTAEPQWFGVRAVSPSIQAIREVKVSAGRYFSPVDYDQANKVIVMGSRVLKELYGENANPIGELVSLSGRSFEIVGLLQKDSGFLDWHVLMPYSTYEKNIRPSGSSDLNLLVKLKNPEKYDETVTRIKHMLAARHGYDPNDETAIRVQDFARWREEGQTMVVMMLIVAYFVGIMTLAIGAVGVMNIMLVNVRERRREIGLRKALGATRRSIQLQFLVEALLLTGVGGFAGIGLGLTMVGLMKVIPQKVEEFPEPNVTVSLLVVAVLVNLVVGVIAGTYPARQAAALDPIVALRDE
jgi:putative ABC transport system permease protein